jgi:hypothetical protein
MMPSGVDHLVIGAADLDAGRHEVEDLLGVPLSPGGKHDRMGTHNCLLGLGPTCYLEVIAIDPQAPSPDRPRWFGLDLPETAARLAQGPCLLTWVVHGVNADVLSPELSRRLGPWEAMHRGDLHWRITLPADGRLPDSGALPALIQWSSQDHPARRLPDRGCRLKRLKLRVRRPETLTTALGTLGCHALAEVQPSDPHHPPGLIADIETPTGLRAIWGTQFGGRRQFGGRS